MMDSKPRKAPPPRSPVPISKDIVEIVKKKGPPPKGPPPSGLGSFVPKVRSPAPQSRSSASMENHDTYSPSAHDKGRGDERSRSRSGSYSSNSSSESSYSTADEAGEGDDLSRGEENPAFPAKPEAGSLSDKANTLDASSTFPKTLPIGKKPVYDYSPISRMSYRQLRQFVTSPGDLGVVFRCYIEREKSLFSWGNRFSLCADLENGSGRELIICQKVQSRSSHYVFSLKQEDLDRKPQQRSKLYLGKLRAVGDKDYVLYDAGPAKTDIADPEDASIIYDEHLFTSASMDTSTSSAGVAAAETKKALDEESLYRKELCIIHFESSKRPQTDEVRALEVCIPNSLNGLQSFSDGLGANAAKGPPPTFINSFKKARSQRRQNELYKELSFILHEKKSKYDALSSCLVDFKGRANVPSLKNFQLIQSDSQKAQDKKISRTDSDDKEWLFQMGKTTKDCYNVDFKAPLSMFQAFAIAIARFDANLSGKL